MLNASKHFMRFDTSGVSFNVIEHGHFCQSCNDVYKDDEMIVHPIPLYSELLLRLFFNLLLMNFFKFLPMSCQELKSDFGCLHKRFGKSCSPLYFITRLQKS